jgi:hypothetical protein
MSSDPKQVAIEALAVLDQRVEAAWNATLDSADRGVYVATVVGRKDPDEARSMSDAELRHLLRLAHIGHTYMCRQKMLARSEPA